MLSPGFDKEQLLSIVEKFSRSVFSSIFHNLEQWEHANDLSLQIAATSFLRYIPLRAELSANTRQISTDYSEAGLLTCSVIAEAVRHFSKASRLPFSQGTPNSPLLRQVAALPETFRLYLWLNGQMDLNKIAASSTAGQFLLRQLAAVLKIRPDAVRKIRERSLKRLQCAQVGESKTTVPSSVGEAILASGLSIEIHPWDEGQKAAPHLEEACATLSAFFRECNPSDLTTASNYIKEIDIRGLSFFRARNSVTTREVLAKLLSEGREARTRFLQRRMTQKVGELSELFLASAAWLFRRDPTTGDLWAEISHNSELDAGAAKFKVLRATGVVGHVAASLRPYIVKDASKDKIYLNYNVDTRSELAVPILDPENQELMAVLNLESQDISHFTESDALRLQSSVNSLLPDLANYLALKKAEPLFGAWEFNRDGWSLDEMLSNLCEGFKQSLRESSAVRAAAMIWEYDEEKDCFWLRGTSGYDYEYATGRGLPASSFLGNVFRDRKPSIVKLSDAGGLSFRRLFKARALNVQWVGACPVHLGPESSLPWGILAIYGFRANERVEDDLFREFASIVANAIRFWEEARLTVARSYAVAKVREIPASGRALNEAVRDVLQAIFEADGVSIFREKGPNRIVCVATTGLEGPNGPVYDLNEAVYDAKKERGATVALFRAVGTVLRKVDASNHEEPVRGFGMPTRVQFENSFREIAHWSPMERRRFLGLGTRGADRRIVLARMVRRSSLRPFHRSDGVLLGEVLKLLAESVCDTNGTFEGSSLSERCFDTPASQMDIKVAAMLQSALLSRRAAGVVCVTLRTARLGEAATKGWELGLVFQDNVGVYPGPEEPRFQVAKKEVSASLDALIQGNGYLLTLKCPSEQQTAIVAPFLVPYHGDVLRYVLEVCYEGENGTNFEELAFWTTVVITLNIALDLAALVPQERLGRKASNDYRGDKSISATPPHMSDRIWQRNKTYNPERTAIGLTLGPLLLGYAKGNGSVAFWIHALATFCKSSPKPALHSSATCHGATKWRIDSVKCAFERFLAKSVATHNGSKGTSSSSRP